VRTYETDMLFFGEYANAPSSELDEVWKEAVVAWCEVLSVFTLRD